MSIQTLKGIIQKPGKPVSVDDMNAAISDESCTMAFQDKWRALMFGIPVGVPSRDLAGEKVLFLQDAPLELEHALRGWLWSQPELVREDSLTYALRFDATGRMAIPWDVWEQYLSWVQQTLAEALDSEK